MVDLYGEFKNMVSLADYLVIIAEAAMGRTATDYDATDPWKAGTLAHRFLTNFKYGRETKAECPFVGRMPNPEHGCEGRGPDKPGLKQIFVDHIYKGTEYPWALTAAISGAHTVGSTNP